MGKSLQSSIISFELFTNSCPGGFISNHCFFIPLIPFIEK